MSTHHSGATRPPAKLFFYQCLAQLRLGSGVSLGEEDEVELVAFADGGVEALLS